MSRVHDGSRWTIDRFISGFQNNAFLVTCKRTNASVIVDTPDKPVELMKAARGTDVKAILITHNHWDHLQGFEPVCEQFPVPVGIGAADESQIADLGSPARLDVSDGAILRAGDVSMRCIATPGHTPGSTCYLLPAGSDSAEQTHVFTGDTLFPGGPGKTGSPENFSQVVDSITSGLYTLAEDVVVLPGHGDFTTIGESKAEYGIFASKPRDPDLYGEVVWTR